VLQHSVSVLLICFQACQHARQATESYVEKLLSLKMIKIVQKKP
jgi:hypothetical protein